jgi:phosphatidylglycerol lysyltransferase
MKSVRNALRKVEKDGYGSRIYEPPLKEGLLQKLATVSNEWLKINEREEIIFSQGMFDEDYLRETTVLTVENAEEKVVAFANIIPDYAPGEATYDLIRKTADAPNGSLDFLMISMFQYLSAAGYARINLGLVPLSGMEQAENMTERTLHFAYQNLRQFAYYQGLREYKDKFKPCWTNKYLVFDNYLDLLQLPVVLSRISKL